MSKKFGLICIVFFAFLAVNFADVEEIENYNMTINLTKSPAHVVEIITIKNLVNYPLVPGIGELRLQKEEPRTIFFIPIPFTEKKVPIKIENLKGYYIINGKKLPLDVNVTYKKTYSIITYQVWDPINGGKNVTLVIEYDANLVNNGILFKTVSIPVGGDLTIKHFHIKFISPYHLTYQNPDGNNFQIPKNNLLIVNAEFSILPLPKLPIHGYLLFWSFILCILIIIFVYIELRRKNKKNYKNGPKNE